MSKKTITLPFYRCSDFIFEQVGDDKYKLIKPIKIYPCQHSFTEKELLALLKSFEPYVYIETKEE